MGRTLTVSANSKASFVYLLREATLILLFIYFLLFANTWRAYADYTLIRNGVVLMGVATVLWLGLAWWKGWLAPTPLSLALGLFLAVYAFTALTSIQPSRSFDEVWAFGMYTFGLALVAQLVANGWPPEVFTKALLIAGSILMGISFILTMRWYMGWLAAADGKLIPDIAYRLPLANGQATYLYLGLFIVVTRWQSTATRGPKILMALWTIPALLLLFLTASRGGWLAAVAGLLVIAAVTIRDRGGWQVFNRVRQFLRQRWQLATVLALVGIVVVVFVVWVAAGQLVNPQKTTVSDARVEFWGPAWRAFLQRPILGQGPLTYGSAYLRYNSVPPHGFYAHAHNTLINLLVESGLVGVAAFLILAVVTFKSVWAQVNRLTGHDRAVAVAALAAIVAWAVHSLVDTVQVEPMNSLMLTVILGAALGKQVLNENTQSPNWFSKLKNAWPIGLGLVLTVSGVYNLWRLGPMDAGVRAAQKNDWVSASANLTEAARRGPGSVIAHQQLGLAESVLADKESADHLQKAVTEFQTVVRLDPDWWLNHANLAALYLAEGQTAEALQEGHQASLLGAGAPLAQLNYGLAAERANALDVARQAYSTTLTLRPELARSYFWRANDFRQSVLQTWQKTAVEPATLTLDEMQTLADGSDTAEGYLPLIDYDLQQGRWDEANVLLKKAQLAYFVSGDAQLEYLWQKARLAASEGDLQSGIQQGQAAIDGYLAQSAFGPGAFGQAAYAEVFFREEGMALDLAPQLTLLPLTDAWADRWVMMGDWQAQQGDVAAAQATYKKVLTLVPDNALALERLR